MNEATLAKVRAMRAAREALEERSTKRSALGALAAVLDLHAPVGVPDGSACAVGCNVGPPTEFAHEWPCPTARLVLDAVLGPS